MMPGIGDDLDVNEMLFQDEPDDETGSDAPPPADGEGSPADSPEGVVAQAQTAPDGEPSSPGEEAEGASDTAAPNEELEKLRGEQARLQQQLADRDMLDRAKSIAASEYQRLTNDGYSDSEARAQIARDWAEFQEMNGSQAQAQQQVQSTTARMNAAIAAAKQHKLSIDDVETLAKIGSTAEIAREAQRLSQAREMETLRAEIAALKNPKAAPPPTTYNANTGGGAVDTEQELVNRLARREVLSGEEMAKAAAATARGIYPNIRRRSNAA